MTATVAHRCDTVAMNRRTATVVGLGGTRTYASTVADRCDLLQSRARTGARARGNILGAMGTVATVCDGAPGFIGTSFFEKTAEAGGGSCKERQTLFHLSDFSVTVCPIVSCDRTAVENRTGPTQGRPSRHTGAATLVQGGFEWPWAHDVGPWGTEAAWAYRGCRRRGSWRRGPTGRGRDRLTKH
jgi:hypothetical protein